MRGAYYGFGDSDGDFSNLLKNDGFPPNIYNRLYPATFQADYKFFRQYGIGPAAAWDLMETIETDAGAMKALQAGVPPDLVIQAWTYQLFARGSTTSNAIVAGQNPQQAIIAGLQNAGVQPVTTSNTGISQHTVSAYAALLPAGMSPGDPYTLTDPTTGKTTTYLWDWYNPPGTPPTAAQTQTSQAQIPAGSNYWTLPSGDVENPDGSITGPAANQQGISTLVQQSATPGGTVTGGTSATGAPSLFGVTLTPEVLWIGGGAIAAAFAAFELGSHRKKGRR